MSQKDYDNVPRWYVIHTYSGYENKVKKERKLAIMVVDRKSVV